MPTSEWLRQTLKWGGKTGKVAVKKAAKCQPVVKCYQAFYGMYKVAEIGNNVEEGAAAIKKFVPSLQVASQSVCDSVKIFTYFNMIATTAGLGATLVLTYQGIQALNLIATNLKELSNQAAAQTALKAQRVFGDTVHKFVRQRLGETQDDYEVDHWFFVYHPDTDWHPQFYHLLEEKHPGRRFAGYGNQIDTIFAFMLAARIRQTERAEEKSKAGKTVKPVRIHLLIPAYQPILIAEKLRIPEELGDFVIEGQIHNNRELVWLNLPLQQRHYVSDIGHWQPPIQGWVNWGASKVGIVNAPPTLGPRRVLGTMEGQPAARVNDEGGAIDDEDTAVEHSQYPAERRRHRQNATALDRRHRHHRGERRHRRRNE